MIDASIASLRLDYQHATLLEKDVDAQPIVQFTSWWNDALKAEVLEANAMTLSTIDEHHYPHSRIVLVKSFSQDGFLFFTNYDSQKGQQITHSPHVSLLFFWKELERQVRIQGIATKVSDADSDTYFYSRPVSSQLGAIASAQSQIVSNRQELENEYARLEKLHQTQPIIRPVNWGGYIVKPSSIEFWQGRTSRLHDRLKYTLLPNGTWQIVRLNP
jgi:pyridoxamine 5'-phosphate oxidase